MPEFESSVVSAQAPAIGKVAIPAGVGVKVYDLVRFPLVENGREINPLGEISEIAHGVATVQLYEGADGIEVGTKAVFTGRSSEAVVAPGMLGVVMSGLGSDLRAGTSPYVERGIQVSPFSAIEVDFEPMVHEGAELRYGQSFATAKAQGLTYTLPFVSVAQREVVHVTSVRPAGRYNVNDVVLRAETVAGGRVEATMLSAYPVRQARPVRQQHMADTPLVTGKRVIDASLPLLEGGVGGVIGGAGTGKTWFTQDTAKWSKIDAVVLVLCGERAAEATEVVHLYEKMGLMDRTVVILNTSAQSAQARGQSVRFGIATAEGLRDMGLRVLVIVDSLSRQGQGDRETAGMLSKMPGRQAFPVDLPSTMAATFDRCGRFTCLSGKEGSITGLMAVSPDGNDVSGDFIAVLARMYITASMYILDPRVSRRSFFPAVGLGDGLSSTKTTGDELAPKLRRYYREQGHPDWLEIGMMLLSIVARSEGELQQQLNLLGRDLMGAADYRTYLLGWIIRRAFYCQDSRHEIDQSTDPHRMYVMMRFYKRLTEVFPHLEDKARLYKLADDIGGQAFQLTLMAEGYEAAYDAIIERMSSA